MCDKISKFIVMLRKEKNMTQKDLADKLGITDRAVSKWERGICLPDITLLSGLANILGVSITELLNGEKNDSKNSTSDDVLKTLDYANEVKIENSKKYSNIILLSLIIFIALLLGLFNLRQYYYMVVQYPAFVSVFKESELIDLVDEKINLINSKKGKYNDTDYKALVTFINNIKNVNDFDKEKEMVDQQYYTYDDMIYISKNRFNIYNSMNYGYLLDLLKKYDKNMDIIDYNKYINELILNYEYINDFISKSYEYNNISYGKIGHKVFIVVDSKYQSYYSLLNKIIEVGGIHE